MKKYIVLLIIIFSAFYINAQNLVYAEYFIDSDPGIGNGIEISLTASQEINITSNISLAGLTTGFHKLFIRFKDENNNWSINKTRSFYIKPEINQTLIPNIVEAEYFIDSEPGAGNGIPININSTNEINDNLFIDNLGLNSEFYKIGIRVKDENGNWSLTKSDEFFVTSCYDTDITPPFGHSLSLKGNDGYVDFGTNLNYQNFTVSFWMKADEIQTSNATVIDFGNGMYFYNNPSLAKIYNFSANTTEYVVLPDKWQYVTVTYENNTMKVYFFGQLISTTSIGYTPDLMHIFKIGKGTNNSISWNGAIDELSVWDRALTPNEVLGIYRYGAEYYPTNLQAYWKFDECSGTITVDNTENHREAILYNTVGKVFSSAPVVGSEVFPSTAGNTGSVTMSIHGNFFEPEAIVKLVNTSNPEIIADTVIVNDAGTEITSLFNFNNAPIGIYDVIVENPDGTIKNYPQSFTLEEATDSPPWVDLVGRNSVMRNRPSTYNVVCGNDNNVNLYGSILWLVVGLNTNADVDINLKTDSLYSPDINLDTIPMFVILDSLNGQPYPCKVYPFVLSEMSPKSTYGFTFKVTSSDYYQLNAFISYSYDENTFLTKTLLSDYPCLSSLSTECVMNVIDNEILFPIGDFKAKLKDAFNTSLLGLLTPFYKDELNGQLNKKIITDDNRWKIGTQLFLKGMLDGIATIGEAEHDIVYTVGHTFTQILWLNNNSTAEIDNQSFITEIVENFIPADILTTLTTKQKSKCYDEYENFNIPNPLGINIVVSRDPNEITGPSNLHDAKPNKSISDFVYSVYFENKEDATAPAQEVFIIDTLDITKFDLSTFAFKNFGFGDTVFTANSEYQFSTLQYINLVEEMSLILEVQGQLNLETGIITWRFLSLDPATMELPEDPFIGFLPPNVNAPEGEGFFSYSVKPKESLVSGDIIENRATIIFDVNPPIATNTWSNLVDKDLPVSSILPISDISPTENFTVSWDGNDLTNEINYYNIYVSVNNTDNFYIWKYHATENSAEFNGKSDSTYYFYSIAVDYAGNEEPMKTAPEAFTVVTEINEVLNNEISNFRVYPNPSTDIFNFEFNLLKSSNIEITITDLSGKNVDIITNKQYINGKYTIEYNSEKLKEGIYFCKLITDNNIQIIKLIKI